MIRSDHGLDFLFEHDLFRKPVSTFRDHALRRQSVQGPRDTKADVEVAAGKGSVRAGGRSNACRAAIPPSAADNMALAVVGRPCLSIERNSGETFGIAILDPLRDIAVHIE